MGKYTPEQRCCRSVPTGISIQLHQCLRKAVVTRNGKGYCKQHDPVEVEKRRAQRSKVWEAKWKRESDIIDRRRSCEEALANIPDPAAYIKAMRVISEAAIEWYTCRSEPQRAKALAELFIAVKEHGLSVPPTPESEVK